MHTHIAYNVIIIIQTARISCQHLLCKNGKIHKLTRWIFIKPYGSLKFNSNWCFIVNDVLGTHFLGILMPPV